MTPDNGIKILELLLNGGVVNVLMALLGLIVLGFLGLVGVIAWLAISQAPKFNQHLSDITLCLRDSKSVFGEELEKHTEAFQVVKTDLKEIKEKVNATHTLVAYPKIS